MQIWREALRSELADPRNKEKPRADLAQEKKSKTPASKIIRSTETNWNLPAGEGGLHPTGALQGDLETKAKAAALPGWGSQVRKVGEMVVFLAGSAPSGEHH